MHQRFAPLTCFLTLAVLAAHSGSAVALDRHKPVQHAQKPHGATEAGHHRNAALRKPGHKAHDKVARISPRRMPLRNRRPRRSRVTLQR